MDGVRLALAFLPFFSFQGKACSDIFVNKGGYHIEGRTLDFLEDLDFHDEQGRVGERHMTDVVLEGDRIPFSQVTQWTNKYGYVGRSALEGRYLIDGLNTQGLSGAVLYLPGTKFPKYKSTDTRPVMSIYDLLSFVLSQAATVQEALKLIRTHQLVEAAARYKHNIFVKDIPIHYVFRDKDGKSAVVEFVNGEVKIYDSPGDVLTNAPPFDWQLKNLEYYSSLGSSNTELNKKFKNCVPNYKKINTRDSEAKLLGLPGDYTPPSRFVRASVLLKTLPAASSATEALYQSLAVTHSVMVPPQEGASPTLWVSIKDLDNLVYYTKDFMSAKRKNLKYSFDISKGYSRLDLKSMNFILPPSYTPPIINLTNPQDVTIIPASKTEAFGS